MKYLPFLFIFTHTLLLQSGFGFTEKFPLHNGSIEIKGAVGYTDLLTDKIDESAYPTYSVGLNIYINSRVFLSPYFSSSSYESSSTQWTNALGGGLIKGKRMTYNQMIGGLRLGLIHQIQESLFSTYGGLGLGLSFFTQTDKEASNKKTDDTNVVIPIFLGLKISITDYIYINLQPNYEISQFPDFRPIKDEIRKKVELSAGISFKVL